MKWVYRILSGIVGVVAIGIGLIKIFGSPTLPDCNDRETFDTIRKAVAGTVTPAGAQGATLEQLTAAVTLDDETEVSYDKKTEVRECTGTVGLTMNGKVIYDKLPVAYTIVWTNKDKGLFQTSVRRR